MTGSSIEVSDLGNPLDFLVDDNQREREVCDLMDELANSEHPDRQDLAAVTTYLKEEFPLHLQDESEDLVPLMRKRCTPEDQIDDVIDRLQSNHSRALSDIPLIVSVLNEKGPFVGKTKRLILMFASHARSHIIAENAILIPIARVRLKAQDLEMMLHNMLSRRGLDRVLGVG